ncbi:cysteine rich repeat-containing protein [Sphaerotilaceae bacterium SBD11-9]
MKIQRSLAGLAMLTCVALSPAFAADPPPPTVPQPVGPLAQACHTDVQTHCPGIQPGEGRIMQCMKKYQSQISDGCKAAMRDAQAKQKKKKAAASAAS